MKNRILLLVLLSAVIISCNNVSSTAQDKNEKTELLAENNMQAHDAPIYISRQDFLDKVMDYEKNPETWVYKGDKPCLIDFYADWCGPCKMAAPILDELAKEYAGKIYIYKVNTMKEKQLSADFGIQGIPAFLYCPMKGNPQMNSGVGRSVEETKEIFRYYIENVLLK